MTGFEQRGVELQIECSTVNQAVRTFQYSCNVCCVKGIRVRCERCAIAITHEQVCAALRDMDEEKRKKEVEAAKANKLASAYI